MRRGILVSGIIEVLAGLLVFGSTMIFPYESIYHVTLYPEISKEHVLGYSTAYRLRKGDRATGSIIVEGSPLDFVIELTGYNLVKAENVLSYDFFFIAPSDGDYYFGVENSQGRSKCILEITTYQSHKREVLLIACILMFIGASVSIVGFVITPKK